MSQCVNRGFSHDASGSEWVWIEIQKAIIAGSLCSNLPNTELSRYDPVVKTVCEMGLTSSQQIAFLDIGIHVSVSLLAWQNSSELVNSVLLSDERREVHYVEYWYSRTLQAAMLMTIQPCHRLLYSCSADNHKDKFCRISRNTKSSAAVTSNAPITQLFIYMHFKSRTVARSGSRPMISPALDLSERRKF
jgi:hypothetical protein